MKITRIDNPYPAISIDDFIPSEAMVRAASESFNEVGTGDSSSNEYSTFEWVRYGGDDGQVQYCSKLGRENVPTPALLLLDYIATHFDPNKIFGLTGNTFHVDATAHGIHTNWKREYSAILCLSEEYDSSFDLRIHNGKEHGTIPYKFNRLNVFKCSNNSWHGLPEITRGMDRKTLGVMYWSKMTDEDKKTAVKAKFNNNLEFK